MTYVDNEIAKMNSIKDVFGKDMFDKNNTFYHDIPKNTDISFGSGTYCLSKRNNKTTEEIHMDFKHKVARKTYEQFQMVRQSTIDHNVGVMFSADDVVQRIDYVTDAVIDRIMRVLGITKEEDADSVFYNVINDGLEDGDEFDYVLRKIDLRRKELEE